MLRRCTASAGLRRVCRWRLGQRGEHRAFGERELTDVLAEQIEARGLDSVHAAPQVDDVEVVLENLVFRQLSFEQARDSELDQFSPERPAVIAVEQEAVVRDLHRDRAEALADPAGAEVPRDGAQHAMPVETVMFIEASVLGGDEPIANRLGHHADRHIDAPNCL
jgi:hypothetical protein